MTDLTDTFAKARDAARGAKAYKEILQSRDISDGQKEQLVLLEDIARELSTGDLNVTLDFSETGMVVVMADANVSVRVPFVFSRDDLSGSAAIQLELSPESLESANKKTPAFPLQYDADKFVKALAQEMILRGVNTLQSRAAKSYIDGRQPTKQP